MGFVLTVVQGSMNFNNSPSKFTTMDLPKLEALKTTDSLRPNFQLIQFNGEVASFTNGFALVRWKYGEHIREPEKAAGKYLHINHWIMIRRLPAKTVLVASDEGIWANVYGAGRVLYSWASTPETKYPDIRGVVERVKEPEMVPFWVVNTSRFQSALSIFKWGDIVFQPLKGNMILITKANDESLVVFVMRSPDEKSTETVPLTSSLFN